MSATLMTASPIRRAPDLRGLALPLALLAAWQLWAITLPAETRVPSPASAVATYIRLCATGDLPISLVQSLGRVLSGFAIGLVFGVALGMLMGASRAIRLNVAAPNYAGEASTGSTRPSARRPNMPRLER